MKPQPVTDKRILKAMASKGLINYPVDKGHTYVEPIYREFGYCGKSYEIQYIDGCFYPFVFEL